MSTAPLLHDVLIIGAGPGGLSTATGLARQLYNTVVFTDETFRNARAQHMHNFAAWDHQPPSVFREKAKEDLLTRYATVRFENTKIATMSKTEAGHFTATDTQGRSWTGRKLVLAQGSEDSFPEIPGYTDCWVHGIFHCLFCHGYEDRGLPSSGVLCVGPYSGKPAMAIHISCMARRLTEKVTLYTNGNAELAESLVKLLENDKDALHGRIHVVDREIAKLERGQGHSSEVVMSFTDGGDSVTEGFLAHQPTSQPKGPFAQQLGLELTPAGDIMVKQPFGETSVPGVFAVGDCATPLKAVAQAVAMGALAAGGLSFQLGAEMSKADKEDDSHVSMLRPASGR
ncbi:hypothetical protein B0T14DRAFT_590197 [Immersiella caudata]|uniref:FAD/NAD(P)-binding domain-containing protein n=1 Tax=Immersiella caudata TaxID=314043 RepID=A0AA39WLG7_9PEZI|nr:hypothetical protein B0T14DRAFT_590197 [Immersiella caudata]